MIYRLEMKDMTIEFTLMSTEFLLTIQFGSEPLILRAKIYP